MFNLVMYEYSINSLTKFMKYKSGVSDSWLFGLVWLGCNNNQLTAIKQGCRKVNYHIAENGGGRV